MLINYLGAYMAAGGKLKEVGLTHWLVPNLRATNESDFTALGAGWRGSNGSYFELSMGSFWWTKSNVDPNTAGYYYVTYADSRIWNGNNNAKYGYSVRCIKDN